MESTEHAQIPDWMITGPDSLRIGNRDLVAHVQVIDLIGVLANRLVAAESSLQAERGRYRYLRKIYYWDAEIGDQCAEVHEDYTDSIDREIDAARSLRSTER